ncbi:PPC domain-containing protein [Archangium sp.]|jgi:serine protease|uniref:PPC domain-containing protein n=1 Tax=Archangium sp. TaxID=1872627 RepID=UPI00389AEEB7
MRIGISCVAALALCSLAPMEARAQFGQCGNDGLNSQEAEARVEWARRCALNKLSTAQGYDVGGVTEYQEVDPGFNPSGQSSFVGDIMSFEVNSTYSYWLYTATPYTQVVDPYGFYKWTSGSKRQYPYYPLFNSGPYSSGTQLYPHPQLADCNLYTDRSGYNVASTFYVGAHCNSNSAVLSNNSPVTSLSGNAGAERVFTVKIPEGSTGLYFYMDGGSGNADMYVKSGSAPTTSTYDCSSLYSYNYGYCYISTPAAGTYYVMVKGASAYSGLSLQANWNELSKGVAVPNLYSGWGVEKYYTFYVPADATSATFKITGGTGDADIYVRYNGPATVSQYDCRPFSGTSTETCSFSYPAEGTYSVMVRGYSPYSGVSLSATYYVPPPNTCYAYRAGTGDEPESAMLPICP